MVDPEGPEVPDEVPVRRPRAVAAGFQDVDLVLGSRLHDVDLDDPELPVRAPGEDLPAGVRAESYVPLLDDRRVPPLVDLTDLLRILALKQVGRRSGLGESLVLEPVPEVVSPRDPGVRRHVLPA